MYNIAEGAVYLAISAGTWEPSEISQEGTKLESNNTMLMTSQFSFRE